MNSALGRPHKLGNGAGPSNRRYETIQSKSISVVSVTEIMTHSEATRKYRKGTDIRRRSKHRRREYYGALDAPMIRVCSVLIGSVQAEQKRRGKFREGVSRPLWCMKLISKPLAGSDYEEDDRTPCGKVDSPLNTANVCILVLVPVGSHGQQPTPDGESDIDMIPPLTPDGTQSFILDGMG